MAASVRPVKIRLEALSFCQLRCPSYPTTGKAIHPVVGSGFLRLSDFRQLLDENPRLKEIELSNYEEIFLNSEQMQYARDMLVGKRVARADIPSMAENQALSLEEK